jgi:hypothetical protein
MTALPPTPDARSQPGNAAGIGAVALAVLIAIAVAALFLVLIGADRTDQVARAITTAPAPTAARPTQPGVPCPPPARTALGSPTRAALTDRAPRANGVSPHNNNTTEGERKQ